MSVQRCVNRDAYCSIACHRKKTNNSMPFIGICSIINSTFMHWSIVQLFKEWDKSTHSEMGKNPNLFLTYVQNSILWLLLKDYRCWLICLFHDSLLRKQQYRQIGFLPSWSIKSRGRGGNYNNSTVTTSNKKENNNNPQILSTDHVPSPSHLPPYSNHQR